jgi:hypothetical protein
MGFHVFWGLFKQKEQLERPNQTSSSGTLTPHRHSSTKGFHHYTKKIEHSSMPVVQMARKMPIPSHIKGFQIYWIW